ncbi:hypothetical protein MG293_020420 [Ovis ammon polii]|uniref:Uncharacterized protein n=1 Tax=Ovis ammon polii TaxID=230172 RepID=A0AAD4TKH2_OVIAM|nr:hypothetical protein MG293_020420 [Ovis ammon polii]
MSETIYFKQQCHCPENAEAQVEGLWLTFTRMLCVQRPAGKRRGVRGGGAGRQQEGQSTSDADPSQGSQNCQAPVGDMQLAGEALGDIPVTALLHLNVDIQDTKASFLHTQDSIRSIPKDPPCENNHHREYGSAVCQSSTASGVWPSPKKAEWTLTVDCASEIRVPMFAQYCPGPQSPDVVLDDSSSSVPFTRYVLSCQGFVTSLTSKQPCIEACNKHISLKATCEHVLKNQVSTDAAKDGQRGPSQ